MSNELETLKERSKKLKEEILEQGRKIREINIDNNKRMVCPRCHEQKRLDPKWLTACETCTDDPIFNPIFYVELEKYDEYRQEMLADDYDAHQDARRI